MVFGRDGDRIFCRVQILQNYGKGFDPEPDPKLDPDEPDPKLDPEPDPKLDPEPEPKPLLPDGPVEPVEPLLGWPVTAFCPMLVADWEPIPPPPVGMPLA